MSYRIDDRDFIDVEPGGYTMPEPNMHTLRVVTAVVCTFLTVGFLFEYKQEQTNIRLLKLSNTISPACIVSPELYEQPWLLRMISLYSGLDDQQARQCHEQRRIDSLLSWPNPLLVLINLLWRATFGDNSTMAITHLLSQQSYVVQVSLIVATAVVIGALLYSLANALPGVLLKLTTRNERQKQGEYQQAQALLGNTQAPVTPAVRRFNRFNPKSR